MLIETKPNIKVVKFTGLTTDQAFTLPAMHTISSCYVFNSGVSGANIGLFNGANQLFSGQTSLGVWKLVQPVTSEEVLFTSSQTIDIESTGGWSGVTLDILVVLIDLSV